MPLDLGATISYTEGDGVIDDLYAIAINLPTTDGGTATVSGGIYPAAGFNASNGQPNPRTSSPISVSGTLTLPTAPISGAPVFYIVTCDSAGVLGIQSQQGSPPAATAQAGQTGAVRILTTQSLAVGQTNPTLVGDETPPAEPPNQP